MRTHKSLLKSRPGKYLFIFTAIGLVVTLGLPYIPFASGLGLTPLPPMQLTALLGIVIAYLITAEVLKLWFFKRYKAR